MSIPFTKLFLSSALSGGGGYRYLPNASGDLNQTVTGIAAAPWISGVADLNADGIPDLVFGAPGDDDKTTNAGRVFISFGAAPGSTTTLGDVSMVIIDGVNAGDLAGAAVGSVSDLNGDGKAEILVGAPGMENGVKTDAGAGFVLWGKTSGGIDLADPFSGGGGGYAIKGEVAGDNAGQAMASIADLNGDGKAEILIGAAGNNAGGTDSGAAYVVFGKSTAAAVSLGTVAAGTGGFKIVGEAAQDHAGQALTAIGDLNGDGKAEILVGAPGNDAGGADAGAVYVVFGKSSGTAVNLTTVAGGTGGFRITGQAGDHVGEAVTSLGDINGDGLADILIGAPGSGMAYVVFGKGTTTEVHLSDVAAGTGGFAITPESAGDLANLSIAGGADLNRDGIADIVIGAPHNGEGGGNAGAVYVIWGGENRSIDLSAIAMGAGGAKIVGSSGSLTGSSVAVLGDMNGDGTADLLIGSPGSGSESISVLFSPTSWQPDANVYGTNGDDVMDLGYGGTHTITSGADAIYGLNGTDTIHGAGGNDAIDGGAGNDTLYGEAGNDDLDGGTGADALVGGDGADVYRVDNAGDTTTELAGGGADTVVASINWTLADNIETLQLAGAGHSGTGNALDNTITGTTGNDTLDGGTGADTLIGGAGNDTYKVDNAADLTQEGAGAGNDTVIASLDWTLDSNIEALQLVGAARHGTGNGLNNAITGTSGDDTLDGAAGADTLTGAGGNDTYYVDIAGDSVVEGAAGGTDTVIAQINYTLAANVENLQLAGAATSGTGNTLDNTLTGTASNDTLDGAAGADLMIGGLGDDTYKVDNLGDVAQEDVTGGSDTVISTIDYTIGANVENLQLAGSAHAGTGNSLDNTITGTQGSDTLDGAGGSDTLVGGAGDDTYYVDDGADATTENASEGTDTVIANVDYTLGANVENLVLTGSGHTGTGNDEDNTITGTAGADTLSGAGGNDTLDGGGGADTMSGGDGDDTYYVDDANDVVVEGTGGGTDKVVSSVDYTAGDNIESVRLTGTAHSITGNDLDNQLSGGSGNDTLDGGNGDDVELGGDGHDVLVSGAGHDSLVGGSGDDRYVLTGGSAHIEDLLGHDTIDASDASGDSYIDLSGQTNSVVENEISDLGQGGTTTSPLDVQFLQDLTGSFGDDIANVRGLVPAIVAALQAVQPDSEFGSSTFVDKPISPFGAPGEWVYNTLLTMTTSVSALTNAYNGMTIMNGVDEPECQIEALMQLSLRATSEVGFRPDSARFVILFTDAPFHVAGDGAAAGITIPNNGDAVLDGTPAGTGEDYPGINQLKAALEAANIIPIFAIANSYEPVYQGLVDQLARGTVVSLTADSSNVVAAITAGLTQATSTQIEEAWGGAGNDTLIGNAGGNTLLGNDGNDSLQGAGGNDALTGGVGNDVIDGGNGTDTVTFAGLSGDFKFKTIPTGLRVIDRNLLDGSNEGTDTLTTVEILKFQNATANEQTLNFTGSAANDVLIAFTAGDWEMHGLEGNDKLVGSAGADTLFGDDGSDKLAGGEGNDILNGAAGGDKLNGGLGSDIFVYASASDSNATAHDRILDLDLSSDTIDLWFSVTGVDAAVSANSIRVLGSTLDAAHLGADHAAVATIGLHTYLVVDANGIAGYQTDQDLLIQIDGAANLDSLGVGTFV